MREDAIHGQRDLTKLNVWRRYQSTLSFVLFVALQKIFPGSRLRIEHSLTKGFYFTVNRKLSHSVMLDIEREMKRLIEEDLPITSTTMTKERALRLFRKSGAHDKIVFLENTRKKIVTVYSLCNIKDMYVMPLFASTGTARMFSLETYPPGYVLFFPTWQDLSHLPERKPQPKLARIFNEYGEWARILGINDIGQLNHAIQTGMGPEIVKITEALHEKKIVYISDRIVRSKKKLILIAGPSSAGKTTFTKRLAIQLYVNGLVPLILEADDYFLPHSQTPRDDYGRLDFESIDAVDIPLLNRHLTRIIQRKKVAVPVYNFRTGRRNRGTEVQLSKNGIVLVEGIHCLNEAFTEKIPKPLKLKIYISALTHLNIDDHNRISTTDTRMLRRIVRDTQFRGFDIRTILDRWSSVRKGEEKNIYPFQEEADEMFNSALIYEPAVLRNACLSIVKRIRKKEPEYEEAQRLADFMSLFYTLGERDVPSNSILREFIGGSSFVY
jgi:uridine kinase